MRAILSAIICGSIAWFAIAAPPPPTPVKKTTAPVSKAVTPAKKGAPTKSAAKAPAKAPARPATATNRYNTYRRRAYTPTPQSPTADRYREIQDALASKGYLKSQPTGVWDKDSMDAMQRFQQDQKLENPNGKLTARSLSALGLGPKNPADSGDQ